MAAPAVVQEPLTVWNVQNWQVQALSDHWSAAVPAAVDALGSPRMRR